MREYQLWRKKSEVAGGRDEQWILVVSDDGETFVEYSEAVSVTSEEATSRRTAFYPLAEFLKSGEPAARRMLTKVLQELGMQTP